MRIIFAGTPLFAEVALNALIQSEHQITAVYTQPDKPAGRGLKLTASPIKTMALMYDIPVFQPSSLKESSVQNALIDLNADAMVVAAYGLLLPSAVLSMFRYGCINIHPSLLPHLRGAAPIERAIFGGDKETGVTIMQMDEGLDTGPILLQKSCPIDEKDTAKTLYDKLARLSAETLLEALSLLEQGKLIPTPQDNNLATYAPKMTKEEGLMDWHRPAIKLAQTIRAFNPWPVAYTTWHGQSLRIWMAEVIRTDEKAAPRTILFAGKEGIDIATGKGVLRLLQVQLPGKKPISIADFYNAHQKDLIVGEHFI